MLFALTLLLLVPFISERLRSSPEPLPLRGEPDPAGLASNELKRFLMEKLGTQTSYGLPRVSMVNTGNNLSMDVRNATREILGQIDFSRFAVARIALDVYQDHQLRRLKLFKDLTTIYSAIFKKFETLDGMLIFIEALFPKDGSKEVLKSVAVAYMTKMTAKKVDWGSILYEDIPSILDYFAWIYPDF